MKRAKINKTVKFPPELVARAEQIAEERAMNFSGVVVQALHDYVRTYDAMKRMMETAQENGGSVLSSMAQYLAPYIRSDIEQPEKEPEQLKADL